MGVDVRPVLIYGVEWEDEYELNELIKGTKYYKDVLAYCKKWDDNFTEDDYLGAGACADNIPNYFISNYSEYGGAPLLGLKGISMISHGSSDAKTMKNAILAGKRAVESGFNKDLIKYFEETNIVNND